MAWIGVAIVGGVAAGGLMASSSKGSSGGGGSQGYQTTNNTTNYNSYAETTEEALKAQIDLAPKLYNAEASSSYGRPAYARLNQKIVREGLTSNEGLISNLGGDQKTNFSDGTYRKAGYGEDGTFLGTSQTEQDIFERAKEQQTQSELSLIQRYGSDLTESYRDQGGIRNALSDYNKLSDSAISDSAWSQYDSLKDRGESSQNLFDGLVSNANEGLALGGQLSAREKRNLEQASRQAMTARGRGRDFAGVVDEVAAKEGAMRERENERKMFASQILGLSDNAFQMDRSFAGQRINMQQANIQQDRAFAAQRVGLEQATSADPFQAITGRTSGASVGSGQNLYGNAAQGIGAGPALFNPHTGAQFMAAENAAYNNYNANMYASNQQASAAKAGAGMGLLGTLGSAAIGAFCWIAREVYGDNNPKWKLFRFWMLTRSPRWFMRFYLKYGESIASWLKDKPKLKSIIRWWMDGRIKTLQGKKGVELELAL